MKDDWTAIGEPLHSSTRSVVERVRPVVETDLGPLPLAPSEQCGCDTRGGRTFFCTYHQGREDERERCAKICEELSAAYSGECEEHPADALVVAGRAIREANDEAL